MSKQTDKLSQDDLFELSTVLRSEIETCAQYLNPSPYHNEDMIHWASEIVKLAMLRSKIDKLILSQKGK